MKHLLKRYFSFFGKASRQQYWLRTLAFLIGSTLLIILFVKASLGIWEGLLGIVWFSSWLWILFATSIRRCRDVGINPHWLWLWLFPFVGNIFYIVLGCLMPDDGVRITRPTPKKGLARYISVFGYATRQEYWCIMIPVTFAIGIASMMFLLTISFLFSAFGDYLLFDILYFFFATANGCAIAWISTATIVRRCRDAALDLRWSIVYIVPLWLSQIAFIPFSPMSSEQQAAMITKPLLPLMQNFSMTTTSTTTFILLLSALSFSLLLFVAIFASHIVFGCLTSKELKSKKKD